MTTLGRDEQRLTSSVLRQTHNSSSANKYEKFIRRETIGNEQRETSTIEWVEKGPRASTTRVELLIDVAQLNLLEKAFTAFVCRELVEAREEGEMREILENSRELTISFDCTAAHKSLKKKRAALFQVEDVLSAKCEKRIPGSDVIDIHKNIKVIRNLWEFLQKAQIAEKTIFRYCLPVEQARSSRTKERWACFNLCWFAAHKPILIQETFNFFLYFNANENKMLYSVNAMKKLLCKFSMRVTLHNTRWWSRAHTNCCSLFV